MYISRAAYKRCFFQYFGWTLWIAGVPDWFKIGMIWKSDHWLMVYRKDLAGKLCFVWKGDDFLEAVIFVKIMVFHANPHIELQGDYLAKSNMKDNQTKPRYIKNKKIDKQYSERLKNFCLVKLELWKIKFFGEKNSSLQFIDTDLVKPQINHDHTLSKSTYWEKDLDESTH